MRSEGSPCYSVVSKPMSGFVIVGHWLKGVSPMNIFFPRPKMQMAASDFSSVLLSFISLTSLHSGFGVTGPLADCPRKHPWLKYVSPAFYHSFSNFMLRCFLWCSFITFTNYSVYCLGSPDGLNLLLVVFVSVGLWFPLCSEEW